MKPQILRILTALLLLCPAAMQAITYDTLPTTPGSVLKDGYIYTVSKNTTITGTDSLPNPLTVQDNATTTIYIPAGVTLMVTGADGNGQHYGYAGIRVPSGTTLIITGEGKLIANGGKSGDGGPGGNGGDGYIDQHGNTSNVGKGGDGGYGGGGGAAGIGGNGGNGHSVLSGPTKNYVLCFPDNDKRQSGVNGENSKDGENGEAMGTVYILGSVKVESSRGAASENGGAAGSPGNNGDDSGSGWSNNYSAGGGGAGGGGGSGYAATSGIGGGGAGGQCGATGGTGGNYWKDGTSHGWAYLHGGSGDGGYGAAAGGYYGNTKTSYDGKSGGNGGTVSAKTSTNGDDGQLYVANKSNVNIDGSRSNIGTATGHDAIKISVQLDANMEGATSGTTSVAMYYGVKPESVTIPVKEGQFFMGYYTSATDGERIYDETGKGIAVCTNLIQGTLYAQWSDTHITSQEQFVSFCKGVSDGSVVTSGATYYLETDVELDSLVYLGTRTYPFCGTFDGQNHTIKLNYATDMNYATVFTVVQEATIKNLNVTGQVKTSARYASGLVGRAYGVTIENCISSLDIISTYSGDATDGGLLALCNDGTFTIRNCAYIGRFYGANTSSWGGIVSYSWVDGSITDSYVGNVFDHDDDLPSATDGNAILHFKEGKTITLTNTWYSSVFNDQGWTTIDGAKAMTPEQCRDGNFCYAINGNSANGAWRQNIGEDSYPVLDTSHNKVFLDYSSTAGTSVPNNRSYVEMTNDMVFNIGYTPNNNTQLYFVYEPRSLDKSNYPADVTGETMKAYTYLYSNGTMTIDDIPATSAHVKSYSPELGTVPLYIQSDCRLYEFTIMENGVVVHQFLPSIYNNVEGFFDTVERKHYDLSGATVFIDTTAIPCQHQYTVEESHNGKKGSHCYLCDEIVKCTYYVYANYDGNGATGTMSGEVIEADGSLSKNQYLRKNYLFNGWLAYDKSGKLISNTVYEDGADLNVSSEFCDTITFKAQWAEAFSYNGQSYAINSENTENIAIIDDGTNGFCSARDFTAAAISYTRTVPSGAHWGSLCLPFAISENDTIHLFKTGRITTDGNAETITLTRCQTVDAGEPCIFYYTNASAGSSKPVTFQADNANVIATTTAGGDANLSFTGVLERDAFKCDTEKYSYYGVQDDVFYNVGTSYVVNPYHTYMSLSKSSAGKQSYTITFEDYLPTASVVVSNSLSSGEGRGEVYNLSGQKVSDNYRGVVIKNGKKMLNR